jgi:hypothetical protein
MKTGYSLLMGAVIANSNGPSFEVASIKPAGPFSFEKMASGQMHTGSIKGHT